MTERLNWTELNWTGLNRIFQKLADLDDDNIRVLPWRGLGGSVDEKWKWSSLEIKKKLNNLRFQSTIWYIHLLRLPLQRGFPGGLEIKNQPANTGDSGSIPESGRSPGEGNDNPLQYYCLGDAMDRGDWLGTVHGVTRDLDTINCSNKALQTGWLKQQKVISS